MARTWSNTNYGREWPAIRRRVLMRDKICKWVEDEIQCDSLATTADHITPKFEGGTDALTNLQGLCAHHHTIKTQAEARRSWDAKAATQMSRLARPRKHPGLN